MKILKSLLTLTASAGIGFQYSYNWYTRQVKFLKGNSKKDIFQVIYFRGLSNIPREKYKAIFFLKSVDSG